MAELVPLSIGKLLTRLFREVEQGSAIFDLPSERFFLGDATRDLSVAFHSKRPGTPLGPAAGPHSQLAQNVVLSWLGGARVIELKTVQIDDRLKIPRPCIDMQTVGYNVEWSQELRLEESLEEYVKASMVIEILVASGVLRFASPSMERVVFDMSVGYDLAGIRSDRVRAFLGGMMDASKVVDRLRREIPEPLKRFRDLEFTTRIADTLTLSTFHGCPPDEIERMLAWLIEDVGLHCIVKLNPTLLGPVEARRILNERLGYPDRVPDDAFAKDTTWPQAVGFVERLVELARKHERGFGVKLTNTLIVENARSFFPPSEKVMYLSGPPLHVLASELVGRVRSHFGDRVPISFSAGIDRKNFADAVGLGLAPVTVCSDLLKTGGYARMKPYFTELGARMEKVGAATIDEWIVLGRGEASAALDSADMSSERRDACRRALADASRSPGALAKAAGESWGSWVSAAKLRNTTSYLASLANDSRYHASSNAKKPVKVGSRLELFDCLTCDKCVPVCPNDANFTYALAPQTIPIVKARPIAGGFELVPAGSIVIGEKHQIATFADLCNECGNCDVFCPEDGGPYVLKPRFFGSLAQWNHHASHDGFYVERAHGEERVWGRFAGRAYAMSVAHDGSARYAGDGFELRCAESSVESTLAGRATVEVDLTYFHIMNALRRAVLDPKHVSWVGA